MDGMLAGPAPPLEPKRDELGSVAAAAGGAREDDVRHRLRQPGPGVRVRGLPGALPDGEAVLWRGKPAWRSLARRLCHVPGVALYFGVVVAGTAVLAALHGSTPGQVALATAPLAAAALLVVGLLAGLAWLSARTTEYTLTTHRLVIRFGMALPATLAIPYGLIAAAAVTVHPDGTGDLPVTMKPGHPVALRRIWPHARPWRFAAPEPMLRSVPEAGRVAALLAGVLAGGAWRR